MVARLNGVQEAAGSTPVTRTARGMWGMRLHTVYTATRLAVYSYTRVVSQYIVTHELQPLYIVHTALVYAIYTSSSVSETLLKRELLILFSIFGPRVALFRLSSVGCIWFILYLLRRAIFCQRLPLKQTKLFYPSQRFDV